jgi:hypothetical protein
MLQCILQDRPCNGAEPILEDVPVIPVTCESTFDNLAWGNCRAFGGVPQSLGG